MAGHRTPWNSKAWDLSQDNRLPSLPDSYYIKIMLLLLLHFYYSFQGAGICTTFLVHSHTLNTINISQIKKKLIFYNFPVLDMRREDEIVKPSLLMLILDATYQLLECTFLMRLIFFKC